MSIAGKIFGFGKTLAPPPAVELLVIQPTPFCNINCDYCYLPNRNSTKRMPVSLLVRVIEKVFASGLVRDKLGLVWHAGEPLAQITVVTINVTEWSGLND